MPNESELERKPHRWRRRAKWALVGIVGTGLLGLVFGNLFLATPLGRGWLAKKISGAMRMPVTVGGASYTPWGGVRVKDLSVAQAVAARSIVTDPFFSAASFEADVRLFSLLRDEVVIDRLVCESPTISMVRGEEAPAAPGDRGTAGAPREEKQAGATQGEATGESQDSVGGQSPSATASSPARVAERTKRRKVVVGELEVRGGSVRVSSFEGDEVIRVEGLAFTFDLRSGGDVGQARFDQALFFGAVKVSQFSSPVEIRGRQVKFSAVDARCAGGALGGELVIQRQRHHIPFSAKLTAMGLEVANLLEDVAAFGVRSAKIGGKVELRGTVQSPRSMQGVGEVRVESARLDTAPEFEKLRSATEADAGGSVTADPAEAKFAIRGGVLGIQEASFGAGKLLVKSLGGVRFDGVLNVATRVYIDADLHSAIRSKPVPGRAPLAFERLEGTDWFYRDEVVTGTVGRPLVDLWRTGEPRPVADAIGELSFELDAQGGDAIGR